MKEPWRVRGVIWLDRERRSRRAVNYPVQLSVRMTRSERDALTHEAKTARLSLSRFLVRTVTEKRYPPAIRDRDELFQLRFQMERAGVNLNQIARRLNASMPEGTSQDLSPALEEVRAAAQALRRACRAIEKFLL